MSIIAKSYKEVNALYKDCLLNGDKLKYCFLRVSKYIQYDYYLGTFGIIIVRTDIRTNKHTLDRYKVYNMDNELVKDLCDKFGIKEVVSNEQ